MSRTPYTTSIAGNLGVNADDLTGLVQTHGAKSAIGQCAGMLLTTLWEMESAERDAAQAVAALADQAKQQAANLADGGRTFDASWLATNAHRANEAGAKLAAGVERLRTFRSLLNTLKGLGVSR